MYLHRSDRMRINNNPFVGNMLKNITLPMIKDKDPNKSAIDSKASREIEEMKRMLAEEARYQKVLEAERISKKIARGEYVTEAEKDQVRGIDAEMLKEAEEANSYRKQLNARLANAKTSGEASAILLEGKVTAGKFMEKGKERYGELLMEAVNQSEADYHNRTLEDSNSPVGVKVAKIPMKQSPTINIRL